VLKLRFLAQCLVSLALLGFLLGRIEWRGLAAIWQQMDVPVALTASLLTFPLLLLLAVRWRIFLRQQHIAIRFRSVLALTWTGQFFNSFLPGSTGGDVSKIIQICRRYPDRKAQAAVTVILDRLSALVAMVMLAGCAWVMGPSWKILQAGLMSINFAHWSLGLLLALMGGAVLVLVARRFGSDLWRERWARIGAALQTGFQLNAGTVTALLLAVLIHFLNFTIFFLFARALGISITYAEVLLMLPVVFLLLLLPVTVNGHGLREVLLIFYFTQFGVHLTGGQTAGIPEIVVSLSAVCLANDLLWSLPGGLLCLFPSRSGRA